MHQLQEKALKNFQKLAELDNREATAQLKQAKAKYDLAISSSELALSRS